MNIQDFTIAEQSHTLLDGLGGEDIGLYDAIERKLSVIGAPEITWSMESADTGFFRALTGKRRAFLRIEHNRLREYVVLVSARSHGTVLHVSWLLLAVPRLANDLRRALRVHADADSRFDVGAELDVFDTLDLNAFLAVTRLGLKTAVRELTDSEDDDAILGLQDAE